MNSFNICVALGSSKGEFERLNTSVEETSKPSLESSGAIKLRSQK